MPPPAFAREARQSDDVRDVKPPSQYDSGLSERKPSKVPTSPPSAPASTSWRAASTRGSYLNGKQTESSVRVRSAAAAISSADREVVRQRLLDDDVLSRLETGNGGGRVEMVGKTEEHRVYVLRRREPHRSEDSARQS